MTTPAPPQSRLTGDPRSTMGGMSRITLDIEWGETPFWAAEDSWPTPLIRPRACPEGADPAYWEPIEGGDVLERYQRVEREFLAVQAELRDLARRHGQLEDDSP